MGGGFGGGVLCECVCDMMATEGNGGMVFLCFCGVVVWWCGGNGGVVVMVVWWKLWCGCVVLEVVWCSGGNDGVVVWW